jgi:flagellin-like protein
MFKLLSGRDGAQRGITGLETAIILIAFVVVASVFAFTVLSTGIFSSKRSKETVFAGLDEVRSSLEPRGSVIAYKGRYSTTAASDTIYKITLVVSECCTGRSNQPDAAVHGKRRFHRSGRFFRRPVQDDRFLRG